LWLYASIAFALGQGILGTVFEFIAVADRFTSAVVTGLVAIAATLTILFLLSWWRDWLRELAGGWRAWRGASLVWKCVAVAVVGFFVYGFSSVGGELIVDAPAFYMAIAKMVGGTGRLVPLPGYDSFSSVGLIAELHMAALYAMGQGGTDPRILPWLSFPPTMALFYGLGRFCSLTRRGALLTVVMVMTSTSVIVLWGSGKTDLLALGPAVAACILVILWWEQPANGVPLTIAGLLTGFACVIKLGYLVGFVPVIAVLTMWRVTLNDLSTQPVVWRDVASAGSRAAAFLLVGFIVAFAPHLLKNWWLFNSVFTPTVITPFFSRSTTIRLLLTYPFALVYGRYWGQVGTISPLVLAYAPLAVFYGPEASHWTRSRVFAVSVAGVAGMAAWMILCPSIFAPRYFLATPLLLGVPAAAAAETLSRRHALLTFLVAPAVFVVMAATPEQTNANVRAFDGIRTSLSRIMEHGPCSGSYPYENDCTAAEAINARARPGDRVLILSYMRLWLRPDLLMAASTSTEVDRYLVCGATGCDATQFWAVFRSDRRFRFVLHNKSTHAVPPGVFESPPPDVHLLRLFSSTTIDAYKVTFDPN
jgi:hypothetical protein